VILRWTKPDSDLYLIYFLIIFGTALTRSLAQSLAMAGVTSALYLMSAWSPGSGFPHESSFWLRVNFLLVSSAFMTILSRDSRQAQREQERRYQERVVQFERLATLGRLAAEVAHRIKGPLTSILVDAEVLAAKGAGGEQARPELDQIRREVVHCREILKGLLDLGRIEEMDDIPFDLRVPLRQALRAVGPRMRGRRIRLQARSFSRPLPMRGDPPLMEEALAAVLHNAVDAVSDGGCVRVSVRTRRPWGWLAGPAAAMRCELIVEDDGLGIARENLDRIFDPFFTTKGAEGSGLGLSAALRILQKHGGAIEAHSDGPQKGSRFTLSVPLRRA
jgi:signal transduction histidine kinase